MDQRSSEIIDGSYYHLVFTVPAELNPLFYANQTLLYNLIHKCSAETILQLAADRKFLGAVPGIIQVACLWKRPSYFFLYVFGAASPLFGETAPFSLLNSS